MNTIATLSSQTPSAIPAHNLKGHLFLDDSAVNFLDGVVIPGTSGNAVRDNYVFQDVDTLGSVFFKRSLEFQHSTVYEVLYGQIEYRNLFSILNFNNAGYTSHTYRVLDKVGRAKLLGSDVNDLPRVDLAGREVNQPIRVSGCSYGLTRQDMASASVTNFDMVARKAQACQRANEELNDNLAFLGDDTADLLGVLNNTDISTSDVPDGAGGFPEWTTKTPDEIYQDIVDMTTQVWTQSKKNHRANTIVLPLAQYNILQSTRLATGTDTTIMEYCVRNIPGITTDSFVAVDRLTGAGAGGVDVMFAYDRDPQVVQYGIGLDLTFLDPQFAALSMVVPAWATTAALMVYRPLGFTIREKI